MPRVFICNAEDLPREGKGRSFYVEAQPNPAASPEYRAALRDGNLRVAVFQVEGVFRVCEDRCPHMESSLARGRIENGAVVCPLHFWNFDLESGACLLAAKCRLPVYKATLEEGALYAEIDAENAPQESDS